jgi:hypothetical protein
MHRGIADEIQLKVPMPMGPFHCGRRKYAHSKPPKCPRFGIEASFRSSGRQLAGCLGVHKRVPKNSEAILRIRNYYSGIRIAAIIRLDESQGVKCPN